MGMFVFILFLSCSSSRMIETNLYFGLSKPDGGMVTEAQWNDFKEKYISKVFKDGYSVFSLSGNWYDTAARKMITEPSYMVTCGYKNSRELSNRIDSMCYWYKTLFMQQAVLRIDRKVKLRFL